MSLRTQRLPRIGLGICAATLLAAAVPPRVTEPAVRAFVARQEQAWNARDLGADAALFTPDAVFVDQALTSENRINVYGRSTLPQAIAQARSFFARSQVRETSVVTRVEIAPDGRSARVFGRETSRIDTAGKPPRTLCAETEQTVALVAGRLLSRGQTDTQVRCRRATP